MTDSEKLAREILNYLDTVPMRKDYRPTYLGEKIRTHANAKVEEAAKMVENPDCIHFNIDDFAALIRSLKE
jgi:hypothetical protein